MDKGSKYLLWGVGAIAAYIAVKSLSGNSSEESKSGEGVVGGTDDVFGDIPYAGGIAAGSPLTSDPFMSAMQSPVVTAGDTPTGVSYLRSSGMTGPSTDGSISSRKIPSVIKTSGLLIPGEKNQGATGLFGTGITVTDASIGVIGLVPSRFTSIGQSLVPNAGTKAAVSTEKKLTQTAADSASRKGVTDLAESGTQSALKNMPFGSGLANAYVRLNTPSESLAKAGLKKAGKTTLALVPFVGTVAGAEFDVRTDNRNRAQAYTANILGDIAGGAANVATIAFGGGVPGDIGAQIGVTQGVYSTTDQIFGRPMSERTEEEKKLGIGIMMQMNPQSYLTGFKITNPNAAQLGTTEHTSASSMKVSNAPTTAQNAPQVIVRAEQIASQPIGKTGSATSISGNTVSSTARTSSGAAATVNSKGTVVVQSSAAKREAAVSTVLSAVAARTAATKAAAAAKKPSTKKPGAN